MSQPDTHGVGSGEEMSSVPGDGPYQAMQQIKGSINHTCRYGWVHGRFDTWTYGGCGCRVNSTGEKQRFGNIPATSNAADFITAF